MYLIVVLIMLICLLLLIRFRPKNSKIFFFNVLNEYIDEIRYDEDYCIMGGVILVLSLLWFLTLPVLIILFIFSLFLNILKKIINKGS